MATFNLNVKRDLARLKKNIKDLSEKKMDASARTASTKTMRTLSKVWLKNVAAATEIKQAVLKKRMTVIRATAKFPSAIIYFRHRQVKYSELGKISILKSKGGVRVGRHYEPKGFIATMKSGHTSAFKRKSGVGRLPIQELAVDIERSVKANERTVKARAPGMFVKEFEVDIKKKIAREFGRK